MTFVKQHLLERTQSSPLIVDIVVEGGGADVCSAWLLAVEFVCQVAKFRET